MIHITVHTETRLFGEEHSEVSGMYFVKEDILKNEMFSLLLKIDI